eukprot:767317-Hanusia_phi.AAC.2
MALNNFNAFGDEFQTSLGPNFFMMEPKDTMMSAVVSRKRPLEQEDDHESWGKAGFVTKRIAFCVEDSPSPSGHDVTRMFRDSWMEHVERPLPFNMRSLRFDMPSQLRESMTSMGWPNMVMARICEFGYDSRVIINIFVNLPPYLKSITLRALHAIEVLYVEKQKNLPANDVLSDSESMTIPGSEVERIFFEQDTSIGFVKHHLCPKTGKRSHVYVSRGWSTSIGIHVEEILSRIANRELPLLSTEFAYFSYVMYSMWSFATDPSKSFSMYARSRKLSNDSEGECCIVQLVQRADLDWTGRPKSMKSYVVMVSRKCCLRACSLRFSPLRSRLLQVVTSCQLDKQQFEDAMKSGNESSKFSRLSLGGRSYEELMQSFETDMFADETILGMQKTVEGEARLRAYAKELEAMFMPIIKIAESILSKNQNYNVI